MSQKTPWGAAGKDEPPLDPALPSMWETLGKHQSGWGGGPLEGEAAPLEALVRVVGQSEGGDDQLAGHAAELPAESLHVLADSLVPTANNTEALSPVSWELPLLTLT